MWFGIPPSPTLPPLVPRGEREIFAQHAKHPISSSPRRWFAPRSARDVEMN